MAGTALSDVMVDGAFVRRPAVFRNVIAKGTAFPPTAGRYLLYVSYACPWACRCLAFRAMKGLEDAIDVAVVAPIWGRTKPGVDEHEGWMFDPAYPGATEDPIFGAKTIREVYERATEDQEQKPERFSVPVLFDKETRRIVNNESSEIIRMFNSEFNDVAKNPTVDLYPAKHREAIDTINESVYEPVNNGVYKCGFAQSQAAYDIAVTALFKRLDELDEMLGRRRFLIPFAGLTEADIRLFVTIVRFDPVYVVHFKTSKKMIREYKNLSAWMKDVYQTPGVAGSVNMDHIRKHYYGSHGTINAFGIVPVMLEQGLEDAHGRDAVPL